MQYRKKIKASYFCTLQTLWLAKFIYNFLQKWMKASLRSFPWLNRTCFFFFFLFFALSYRFRISFSAMPVRWKKCNWCVRRFRVQAVNKLALQNHNLGEKFKKKIDSNVNNYLTNFFSQKFNRLEIRSEVSFLRLRHCFCK